MRCLAGSCEYRLQNCWGSCLTSFFKWRSLNSVHKPELDSKTHDSNKTEPSQAPEIRGERGELLACGDLGELDELLLCFHSLLKSN